MKFELTKKIEGRYLLKNGKILSVNDNGDEIKIYANMTYKFEYTLKLEEPLISLFELNDNKSIIFILENKIIKFDSINLKIITSSKNNHNINNFNLELKSGNLLSSTDNNLIIFNGETLQEEQIINFQLYEDDFYGRKPNFIELEKGTIFINDLYNFYFFVIKDNKYVLKYKIKSVELPQETAEFLPYNQINLVNAYKIKDNSIFLGYNECIDIDEVFKIIEIKFINEKIVYNKILDVFKPKKFDEFFIIDNSHFIVLNEYDDDKIIIIDDKFNIINKLNVEGYSYVNFINGLLLVQSENIFYIYKIENNSFFEVFKLGDIEVEAAHVLTEGILVIESENQFYFYSFKNKMN